MQAGGWVFFSSSWAWNCLHLDLRTPLRYSIEQRPSTKLCNIVVFGHGVESFTNLVLNLDLQLPKLIANYLIENFFMSSSWPWGNTNFHLSWLHKKVFPHMALHKKVFPYTTLASISNRDVSMPLTTNLIDEYLDLGYPDALSIIASYTTQFMPRWVPHALLGKGTTWSVRPTHPQGLSGPTTRSTIAWEFLFKEHDPMKFRTCLRRDAKPVFPSTRRVKDPSYDVVP